MVARSAWQGIIMSTAPMYLKGAVDLTIRGRLLLKWLQQKGRIKFNVKGDICTWTVQRDEQPVTAYGDGGDITFSRHNLLAQLSVDWRGYKATDLMTEQERLQNDGDVAIVKRYDRIIPTLVQSLQNKFCGELFIDGYASGNENRLHGLESFLGTGTTNATDIVAQPDDTYGGLSTKPGNEGGSWSTDKTTSPNATIGTDWPSGNGDVLYDYLSPKIINYSSSNWGTGSTTWSSNASRCIRRAISWLTLTGGQDGMPDLILLDGDLFYDYKTSLESKQRIIVPHKKAQDLGFEDTLNQDGVAITQDYDVPAETGYILNVDQMVLASQDSMLFSSRGPLYSIDNDAYKFMVGFFGNCRYNPKFFGKLAAIA